MIIESATEDGFMMRVTRSEAKVLCHPHVPEVGDELTITVNPIELMETMMAFQKKKKGNVKIIDGGKKEKRIFKSSGGI